MAARKDTTAAALIPKTTSLATLRKAAANCQACDLYKRATQTVFGEGPRSAATMFIGEQPGNEEDLLGKPFVGPAGKLLDKALHEAGIDRKTTFVTNVVKHFKWSPRWKRRIHDKPDSMEIRACVPWLQAEIEILKPKIIVCLGATAAQTLLGKQFRVTVQRGQFIESTFGNALITATIHPSSILRSPDKTSRQKEMQRFVEDLRKIATRL